MASVILKIEWLDMHCIPQWTTDDEIKQLDFPPVISVGYLHSENETWLNLIGCKAEDKDATAIQTIPKGCIISRTVLKEATE